MPSILESFNTLTRNVPQSLPPSEDRAASALRSSTVVGRDSSSTIESMAPSSSPCTSFTAQLQRVFTGIWQQCFRFFGKIHRGASCMITRFLVNRLIRSFSIENQAIANPLLQAILQAIENQVDFQFEFDVDRQIFYRELFSRLFELELARLKTSVIVGFPAF
ncbi:MAG: hypothetical protein EB051_00615 [Chlamydiia bacterium]|nr:hypothetical protein [Chlamydiia bacterium]